MHTNEWEEYVPCSRLKTKRRKKRLQKTDKDKKLIKLFRKSESLRKQIRDLGYEELTPPVQRGWKRTFVLRYDVAISTDAAFFEALLDKVNNVQYSPRRDFKIKQRKNGKKIYVSTSQELETIHDYKFRDLVLTDKENLYFKEDWIFTRDGKYKIKCHVFTEPWRFVLKVTPNMITKVKILDPLLLQEVAEIDDVLERQNLYPRLGKLTGSRNYYNKGWGNKEKEKYQLDAVASEELLVKNYNRKENEYE